MGDRADLSQKISHKARKFPAAALLGPLFLLSLGLHGLLLGLPTPSGSKPTAESTPTTAEEGPVDLLSISTLASPEAEIPLEETAPPPEAPLPEPAAQPQAPQPVAPGTIPPAATLPPEEPFETPPDSPPPPSSDPPIDPPVGFDPARRQSALQRGAGIGRAPGESVYDQTDKFPTFAWSTLSTWSADDLGCFFADIREDAYTLAPGVADLKFLTRNFGLVLQEDLPKTFAGYSLVEDPNGYCGQVFYEVQEAGEPLLFLSLIGVGVGNPPANAIVIFWETDPRSP